eukprot:scaffold4502_cov119-Isochrysis_galbana.AAC.5
MRGLRIILSEFAFANAKFNLVQRLFPPHTPTLASDGQRAAADGRRPSGGGGLRRRALEAPPVRGVSGGDRRAFGAAGGAARRSQWLRLSLQEHGGGGLWRLPGCLDLLGRLRRRQSSPLVFGTGPHLRESGLHTHGRLELFQSEEVRHRQVARGGRVSAGAGGGGGVADDQVDHANLRRRTHVARAHLLDEGAERGHLTVGCGAADTEQRGSLAAQPTAAAAAPSLPDSKSCAPPLAPSTKTHSPCAAAGVCDPSATSSPEARARLAPSAASPPLAPPDTPPAGWIRRVNPSHRRSSTSRILTASASRARDAAKAVAASTPASITPSQPRMERTRSAIRTAPSASLRTRTPFTLPPYTRVRQAGLAAAPASESGLGDGIGRVPMASRKACSSCGRSKSRSRRTTRLEPSLSAGMLPAAPTTIARARRRGASWRGRAQQGLWGDATRSAELALRHGFAASGVPPRTEEMRSQCPGIYRHCAPRPRCPPGRQVRRQERRRGPRR